MSKVLKEVTKEPCRNLEEGHFRQRQQYVQRPCGGTMLGASEVP